MAYKYSKDASWLKRDEEERKKNEAKIAGSSTNNTSGNSSKSSAQGNSSAGSKKKSGASSTSGSKSKSAWSLDEQRNRNSQLRREATASANAGILSDVRSLNDHANAWSKYVSDQMYKRKGGKNLKNAGLTHVYDDAIKTLNSFKGQIQENSGGSEDGETARLLKYLDSQGMTLTEEGKQIRARTGDVGVLDDQRKLMAELEKSGSKEERKSAEDSYELYTQLLRLSGYEKVAANLNAGKGLLYETYKHQNNYDREQLQEDLMTVEYGMRFGSRDREYTKAKQRLDSYYGRDITREIQLDGNLMDNTWAQPYLDKYDQDTAALNDYINQVSGLAGTDATFDMSDYMLYQNTLTNQERQEARYAEYDDRRTTLHEEIASRPGYDNGSQHIQGGAYYTAPQSNSTFGYYDEDNPDVIESYDSGSMINDLVYASADESSFNAKLKELEQTPNSELAQAYAGQIRYMTDEDRKDFFYVYNVDGLNAALDLLGDPSFNFRQLQQYNEALASDRAEFASQNWATAAAASVLSVGENLLSEAAGASELIRKLMGEEITEYDPAHQMGMLRDTTRGQVGGDIAAATEGMELLGLNVPQSLYSGLMSGADSVANAAIYGHAAPIAMGLSAFDSSYRDRTEKMGDTDDALIDSIYDGLVEMATEYFSVESLLDDAAKGFWKTLVRQVGTENSEELVGEILRTGRDAIKYGDESTFSDFGADKMAAFMKGFSQEDAETYAKKQAALDLLDTIISTSFSSGLSGARVGAQQSIANRQVGSAVQQNAELADYESLASLAETVQLSRDGQRLLDKLKAWIQENGQNTDTTENAEDNAEITETAEALAEEVEASEGAQIAVDVNEAVEQSKQAAQAQQEENTQAEDAVREEAEKQIPSMPVWDRNQTRENAKVSVDANEAVEQSKQAAQEQRQEQTQGEEAVQEKATEAPDAKTKEVAEKIAKESKGKNKAKQPSKAQLGQLYREVAMQLDEKSQATLRERMSYNVAKELSRSGIKGETAKELAQSILRIQDGSMTAEDVAKVQGNDEARSILLQWTKRVQAEAEAQENVRELARIIRNKGKQQEQQSNTAETEDEGEETEFDAVQAEVTERAANVQTSDRESSTLDGENVQIIGVMPPRAQESGETMVKILTESGEERTVAADSIVYGTNDEGKYRLSAYAEQYGRQADMMFDAYQPEQNVDDYARAFATATQYGSDGRNLNTLKASGTISVLNDQQATIAYEIGRSQRIARGQEQQSVRSLKGANVKADKMDTTAIRSMELTQHQKQSLAALDEIRKALGINVKVVASEADAQGQYTTDNGSWNADTRTLTVDINAGSNYKADVRYAMMDTVGHELTHYIRQMVDNDLWNEYQDFVVSRLDEKLNLNEEIDRMMAINKGLNRDDAIEEIVAEASVRALERISEQDLTEIAEHNPTLFKRIRNFITKWISDIRQKIQKAYKSGKSETNRFAEAMSENVDELAAKWSKLLVKATINANGTLNETGESKQQAQTENKAQKQKNDSAKLFIPYTHIDARTLDSVKDDDVQLFSSEVEIARVYYSYAAEILLGDVNMSIPGERIFLDQSGQSYNDDANVIGVKRMTTDLLAEIKDSYGLTWKRMGELLQGFVDVKESQELKPVKNTLNNRRMEIYLHEMLTHGYTTLDGMKIAPSQTYAEMIAEYQGSRGDGINAQIPNDAIPFEAYFSEEAMEAWDRERENAQDVKFSARDNNDAAKSSIKQQIAAHEEELNNMNVAADVQTTIPPSNNAAIVRRWALEQLKPTGYRVDRKGFGTIEFSEAHIKNSLNYLHEKGEIAALDVLPQVLKRGIIAGEHTDHKFRGFATITFAAPVRINGVRGNMAVVVKQEGRNVYKTHRILMPDGSMFEYKENTEPSTARGVAENGSYASPISSVSEQSIAQNSEDVKFQMRDPYSVSDRELLAKALESTVQSVEESNRLRLYQKRIAKLNETQRKLDQTNDRIRMLRAQDLRANKDEIARLKNQADIYAQQISRADSKLLEYEALAPLKELAKRQRASYRQELQQKTREEIKAYKKEIAQQNRRIKALENSTITKADVQQAVKDTKEQMTNRRKKEYHREKILADVQRISKWISQPSNKGHVPEMLKAPIGDFLQSIDVRSRSNIKNGTTTKMDVQMTDALESLRRALAEAHNQQSMDDGSVSTNGYIDLPANYLQELDALVGKVKQSLKNADATTDTPLMLMSLPQLEKLSEVFSVLKKSIGQSDQLFNTARYKTATKAANDTIDDMQAMNARKKSNKLFAAVNSAFNWKNATPFYAFQRMGAGGRAIFEGLQDGWDKMAKNSTTLIDFAENAFTPKQAKAWSNDIRTIELDDGVKIQMTMAQLMSLYCLSKRAQAQGHLLGGGIRVADIQGKMGNIITQTENYTLTQDKINEMIGMLSEEQRKVADKLQTFMNTTLTDWGNEISMARFGYNMFTESNYFPIQTDSNNRASIDDKRTESSSMFRLLNMGALKPLTPKANNAIIISDIFDVFSNHASDIAKYNAMALPILDFIKWYNYVEKNGITTEEGEQTGRFTTRSTQKALEHAYGKDAKEYLLNFIKDINSEHDGGRNDGMLNRLMSKAKAGAVGWNARVYFLQITSMPRAAYAINPKYLLKGMMKLSSLNPINAIRGTKAQQEIGILQWKNLGFYNMDVARNTRDMVRRDSSVLDKIRDWGMKPAEWGDNWTSNIIYEAVKAEMKDKYPSLEVGSKAYREQLNRRVRDIVYKTQVVDSTMTRSDFMRSKGMMTAFTAFMSEPTLTANMLNESIQEAVRNKRAGMTSKENLRSVGGKVVRAATVFAFSAALTAVMEALFDALRDDDDYETFWEKFKAATGANFADNVNIFAMLPIIKDIISIMQGYENNSLITQAAEQFVDLKDTITAWQKGKRPIYSVIYNMLKVAGSSTGIGVQNATRDGVGLYNTFLADAWKTPKVQTYSDGKATAAGKFYEALRKGDADKAEWVIERAKINGYVPEDFETKIRSLIKDDLQAGNIDTETAMEYLVSYGGSKDANDAYWRIDEWSAEIAEGEQYSKYGELHSAVASGNMSESKKAMRKLTEHGVEEKTVTSELSKIYNNGSATNLTNLQLRSDRLYTSTLKLKADGEAHPDDFDALIGAIVNGSGISGEISKLHQKGYTTKQCMSAINGAFGNSSDRYRVMEKYNAKDAQILLNRILDAYVALGLDRNEERAWIDANWVM